MLLRFLEILSKKVQPNCSKDQGGEGGLVMQGVPNHVQYPYLKIMRLAVFFNITNILVAFVTNMRYESIHYVGPQTKTKKDVPRYDQNYNSYYL